MAQFPENPLEAYLSTRNANQQFSQQSDMQGLQAVGILQKLRNEQEQKVRIEQFRIELAAADTPEKKIAVATKYSAPAEVLQHLKGMVEKPIQPIGAGGAIKADGTLIPPQARPETPKAQSIGSGGLRLPSGEIIPPAVNPNRTEPVSERVVQDTTSPTGWSYEDARTRVRRPGAPVPSGNLNIAGGRESVYVQRMMMGANQAAKDLANVVQLPITASTGMFGGRRQGPGLYDATKEVLANKSTGQEAQAYNAMATGFQRSLAQIESAGLMPSGSLTHQMDAVLFKEGDTNLTKLHKLAQTRQIVEAGMEVIEANPRVTSEEKAKVKSVLESVRKSVPFTHSDLIQFQVHLENNPKATLGSFMKQRPTVGSPKEGDEQTSKSGKPMIYRNNQWEYK